jgi:hypothetical protein
MRNVRPAVWIFTALVACAGCSHGTPTASSQAPVTQSQSASALGPASPAASAVPISPRRLGTFLARAKVPRLPSEASPQILTVAMSETTVRPGDRIFGSVITTSNVASVEVRIGGYGASLTKVGVGRFELSYTVAPLPWFVRGTFAMQLVARNPHGDATTRVIPLTVR